MANKFNQPVSADPIVVIGVCRRVAAAGGNTRDVITKLCEEHPDKFMKGKDPLIDQRWLGARLTYYRRNPDLAALVPTFGGIGSKQNSTAAVAAAILAEEEKTHGKRLLPPQPLRLVELPTPDAEEGEGGDENAEEPAPVAEEPVADETPAEKPTPIKSAKRKK